MTQQTQQQWLQHNKAYLVACLDNIRHLLSQTAGVVDKQPFVFEYDDPQTEDDTTTALATLCALFGLTAFERNVLLLCAGIELDSEFCTLCAAAHGDPSRTYPTFGLALGLLPDAFWNALTPDAALRRWRLIEIEEGHAPLTQCPLRIDERILHYLLGTSYLDPRLVGLVYHVPVDTPLVPSHQQLAQRLVAAWTQNTQRLPVIQLCGRELLSKQQIAGAASGLIGYSLCSLSATTLLPHVQEIHAMLHLWEREALLNQHILFLNCDTLDAADAARRATIVHVVEQYKGILVVSCQEQPLAISQPCLVFDVQKPTPTEQQAVWLEVLDKRGITGNGQVKRLTAYFHLDSSTIRSLGENLPGTDGDRTRPAQEMPQRIEAELWKICRKQARPRLEHLAQAIEPKASWDDLVLPELQLDLLHEIAVQVRLRDQVYDSWGFRQKSSHGLGVNALFFGPSGVGKTMAAEVLAHELQLDLYRIDLSSVVSKYIGETEKNLRQIFDAAEESSVILLFDEADALFGKRTEVRDSHDRYANVEISYLLQRMESYSGLAILTTNLKDILDTAFLRRIRFLIQFPFPDTEQRIEIWRRVFPSAVPTEGLDFSKLAQLTITGGNIRTIAVNAAFLAAGSGEPLRMDHLLRAARHEYTKLEKPFTPETRGWT